MRNLSAELTVPKYAHIERERRWLVDPGAFPDLKGCPWTDIIDHYIYDSRIRLRRMADDRAQTALKLTKKYDTRDPTARPIVTTYLTEAEYCIFADLPASVMQKRRYRVEHEQRFWSLDIFEAPQLPFGILEIEAQAHILGDLTPPSWAGREITDNPLFTCGALVLKAPEKE